MAVPRMHTHYMGMSGPALHTAIGLTAGLCFVAFGYGQGDIGGLLIQSTFGDYFPQFDVNKHPGHEEHASVLNGVVVATWNIGCFVGAFFTIFCGDRLGRKGTIILGLVLETIGKIIQATSFSLGQYIAGRFVAGVGNGFIASTIPAWQAETLKTHRRGTLLMVSFGTCITLGTAIAYWMTYAFSFTAPSTAAWRVPIILAVVFTLPALAIITFMPESPRWLLLQGREQEAISVLSALNELPEESEDIRREILQIKNAVKHMASAPASWVFTNGEYRYLQRTLLAVLLQVMQQFTGINLFMQYLGGMFKNQLMYPTKLSLLLASCCATEFVLASFVAVIGIDRFWGRRTLTMFGSSGMCVCMIGLCVFNYVGLEGYDWAFKVMTLFLFAYNTFFSIGWQGMSWMWAVEIIPLSIRGPANALATAANWLSNFIVVLVTPLIFTTQTYKTYIIFAVTNFCMVPTIYFLYPETGSRSLEEVDLLFRVANQSGSPWLGVVRTAEQEPRWFDKHGDPTDSYGSYGGSSEKGDYVENTSSSGGENESPDRLWRNQVPQTRPQPHQQSPLQHEQTWDDQDAAPAPAIKRTHSSERGTSRGSGSRGLISRSSASRAV